MLNETKRLSHSSLIWRMTAHLKLQSRLAFNFCTAETEILALDPQVDQIALSRVMGFCVPACN